MELKPPNKLNMGILSLSVCVRLFGDVGIVLLKVEANCAEEDAAEEVTAAVGKLLLMEKFCSKPGGGRTKPLEGDEEFGVKLHVEFCACGWLNIDEVLLTLAVEPLPKIGLQRGEDRLDQLLFKAFEFRNCCCCCCNCCCSKSCLCNTSN